MLRIENESESFNGFNQTVDLCFSRKARAAGANKSFGFQPKPFDDCRRVKISM
jgi:hypothetical protein